MYSWRLWQCLAILLAEAWVEDQSICFPVYFWAMVTQPWNTQYHQKMKQLGHKELGVSLRVMIDCQVRTDCVSNSLRFCFLSIKDFQNLRSCELFMVQIVGFNKVLINKSVFWCFTINQNKDWDFPAFYVESNWHDHEIFGHLFFLYWESADSATKYHQKVKL